MVIKAILCLLILPIILAIFFASGSHLDGFSLSDAILLYMLALMVWFIQSKTDCRKYLTYIGIDYYEKNSLLKCLTKNSIIYWLVAFLLIYVF